MTMKVAQEVLGSRSVKPSQTIGMSFRIVDHQITVRAPSTGMSLLWVRRRIPEARPGIAASQNTARWS